MPDLAAITARCPNRLQRFEALNRALAPVFLLAALVGAGTGLLAAALLRSVSLIDHGRRFLAALGQTTFGGCGGAVVSMIASALLALAAVWLVRTFAPEAAGSGIQEIEGALAGVRALRPGRVLPVKLLGGALSLGAGLSLGREGPTIHMGGVLGRLLGRVFRTTDPHILHSLAAAGAAA